MVAQNGSGMSGRMFVIPKEMDDIIMASKPEDYTHEQWISELLATGLVTHRAGARPSGLSADMHRMFCSLVLSLMWWGEEAGIDMETSMGEAADHLGEFMTEVMEELEE